MRIVLITLALALTFAATANAGFQHRAERAQAVAVGYWGASPAHCPEVRTVREPLLNEDAEAEAGECTIYFRPDWFATRWRHFYQRFCSVYVHEWGHLLGYGHSTDPGNIMYGDNVPLLDECEPERRQFKRKRR